jgi:hypothetical protein
VLKLLKKPGGVKIDIYDNAIVTMYVGVIDRIDIIQIEYTYIESRYDYFGYDDEGYYSVWSFDKDLNKYSCIDAFDENRFTYKIDLGYNKKWHPSPAIAIIEELLRSKINVSRVAFLDLSIKCKNEYPNSIENVTERLENCEKY